MTHPRILKALVVVLLMHVGVLMSIQLGLIAPRPIVGRPPGIQTHIIPATLGPIKQPEPLKQQPVKQEILKPVNIVRPVAQPKPMSTPTLTLMLPPSDNAPMVLATSPAPPASAPEQAPAPAPASSDPIGVSINDIQCGEPPLVYPSMSQKIDEKDCAMARISIGVAGEVINVVVMSSSDLLRLGRAAADAAHITKCNPCRQSGRAIPMVVSKPFIFKFDN